MTPSACVLLFAEPGCLNHHRGSALFSEMSENQQSPAQQPLLETPAIGLITVQMQAVIIQECFLAFPFCPAQWAALKEACRIRGALLS